MALLPINPEIRVLCKTMLLILRWEFYVGKLLHRGNKFYNKLTKLLNRPNNINNNHKSGYKMGNGKKQEEYN